MDAAELMSNFPPDPAAQVTLANWRKPPFNKWSFQHVREIVPSAEIANDPANVRQLRTAGQDLSGFSFKDDDGARYNLQSFLEETDTDGIVILKGGEIAYEFYPSRTEPETPHILMSVSKSVLGLIAGILANNGRLDLQAPVTDLIPEIANSAYANATLRNLLDMRVGVLFDEDYFAIAGPIIEYRKAQNWDPLPPGENPSDLRSFVSTLVERDGDHNALFHYVSPNTDLLGWVIERATGQRYADLVADLLWRPMGAERSAYITVDRLGAPRCAGGVCATPRDLARLGLLLAEGGARDGRRIVPQSWIDDIVRNGDAKAWDSGDFAAYFPGVSAHYRSKWYVATGESPLIFAVGVFGQNLFIDQAKQLVIAKVSSQALPMDARRILLTMRGIEAIRASFR